MSAAETLTAAADRIERLAGDATPGPWRAAEQTHGEWVGIQGQFAALGFTWSAGDAAYIVAMNPAVAIPLAPVLKQAAMDSWAHGWPDCCADGCDECDDNLMAPYQRRLLAFAQGLLNEGASK